MAQAKKQEAATLGIRRLFLLKGMELEYTTGMRLTGKRPSAFAIVRLEEGFKGNRRRIYEQFVIKYDLQENLGQKMMQALAKEDVDAEEK